MNETDRRMFAWVRVFNPCDLYTKHDIEPNLELVMPYYHELESEYFPDTLQW